jgi:shikimate kinase
MYIKRHVILVGMPGSGKSSLGFYLSKLMWRPFIDTDNRIIMKMNKSIAQLFDEQGEDSFRQIEHGILSEVIASQSSVISTGGGMPCFRDNMNIMNGCAVTVYLEVPADKLFEHLRTDTRRPLIKGKTDDDLRTYINTALEQRLPYYTQADITVQSHNKTPVQLAMETYKYISNFWESTRITI